MLNIDDLQRYDFESGEDNEPLPIMVPVHRGDYVKVEDLERILGAKKAEKK